MLTHEQLDQVARRMHEAGRFTPKQVEEWMATMSGDASGGWSAAATRLIWREEDAGRVAIDGNEGFYRSTVS